MLLGAAADLVQDSKQQLYDITVSSIGAIGPHAQDSISNTRQSMRGEIISLQQHLEAGPSNNEISENFDSSLALPSIISEVEIHRNFGQ